ncbi:12848_t:CDS:2 [Cetraspora pellucida]|uniref:12848_t:CDS:1 n=1 Tax=Cetraspora pellucida TaxID=1433469 RepID=A0A9N8ZV75_9GLOM|nr:12848_t:CDS:2 [Cetraspora pellucida]
MSAAGLDMSLDEIIAKKKPSRGNRSGGPTRGGGIAKRSGGPVRNTRSSLARSRPYAATSTATNISASPEGKILVSNLAYKVSEADLWVTIKNVKPLSVVLQTDKKETKTTFVRKFLSSTALLRLVALVPGESEIFSTTFSNPNNLIAPSENKPPDRYQTLHTRTSTPLIPLQHQELFQTMIGPVRQVNLNFDQSGRSKGTASVVFARKNDAVRSVEKLRNITLDGRELKIEFVVAPNASPISQRIGGVNETRSSVRGSNSTRGSTRARGGRGGSRRADNRPKKTQEELDAEMSEYMQIDEESSQAPDSSTAPLAQ